MVVKFLKQSSKSGKRYDQDRLQLPLLYTIKYLLELQVSQDKHSLQIAGPLFDIFSSQRSGEKAKSPDVQVLLQRQRWTVWGRYPDRSFQHSGSGRSTSDLFQTCQQSGRNIFSAAVKIFCRRCFCGREKYSPDVAHYESTFPKIWYPEEVQHVSPFGCSLHLQLKNVGDFSLDWQYIYVRT